MNKPRIDKMIITFATAKKPKKIYKIGDRKTLKDGTVKEYRHETHQEWFNGKYITRYVYRRGKPVYHWIIIK